LHQDQESIGQFDQSEAALSPEEAHHLQASNEADHKYDDTKYKHGQQESESIDAAPSSGSRRRKGKDSSK